MITPGRFVCSLFVVAAVGITGGHPKQSERHR